MVASPRILIAPFFYLTFLIFLLALSSATWASPQRSGTNKLLLLTGYAPVPKEDIGRPLDSLLFPAYQSADIGTDDGPEPSKLQSAKLVFRAFQQPEPEDGARQITDKAFPGWTRAMRLHGAELAARYRDCGNGDDCPLDGWRDFLEGIQGQDRKTQLKRVNDFVNRFAYRSDESNWDRPDYWAPPAEFFNAGGDCEDFAIAKFFSLKLLGIPTEDMRIVVLRDDKRQTNHAVLTVEYEGETLMLDSVEPSVMPWREASHYRPYFSVNDRYFWLHTAS